MKSKTTLLILALLSFSFCSAQTLGTPDGGGEFVFNPQKSECLTELQRQEIFTQLNKSINKLNLQKKLAFSKSNIGNHPLFTWPVQKASSTPYNEVWAISNYVIKIKTIQISSQITIVVLRLMTPQVVIIIRVSMFFLGLLDGV